MATQTTFKPIHTKGDTYDGALIIYKINNGSGSIPVDLTGVEAKLLLKETYQSSPSFEYSTDNGLITFPSASAGELQLEPTIIDIDAGEYVYDLQLIFPDGRIKSWLRGEWIITNDVSN